VALQVLYALDRAAAQAESGGRGGEEREAETRPEECFEDVAANFEMPAGTKAFARELVSLVYAHRAELDRIIGERARNWRISRMAMVDRNVLRLATCELLHSDTPTAVVIDEAVELARHFGSDASPSFVNGILDAVAKDVRE
jgi:N utilization substance protein B